jgi:hypothetical protein
LAVGGWTATEFGLDDSRATAFASAAPPTTASTKSDEKPSLLAKSIEDLRLGDRVLGTNPNREEVDEFAPEPDPATWRAIRLVMTKEDGSHIDIELLRPLDWIALHAATMGATIHLDLPEMGAEGPAVVTAIEPCPTIEVGAGNVVTGRFIHEAANVVDLTLQSDTEPIGVTDNHPFWSVTRQAWVPAGELVPSEEVLSLTGERNRVTSVLPRPGPSVTVYNIEVNREHVYSVGEHGTLVHNNCAAGLGRQANTFPDNPSELLSELPRDARGRIYPNSLTRIRPEQHALLPAETFNPRHHGLHYHVEIRPTPNTGWNNPAVKKVLPPGYMPGSGTGVLPGELFPGF